MDNFNVRIKRITIQNLKNVEYGVLSFENNRKCYKASVLGLYGQNGSGKTVLIDAIELLKYVLCGRKIPVKFADYVNVQSEYAKLSYVFTITSNDGFYEVYYDFCMERENDDSEQNLDTNEDEDQTIKVVIKDEVLSYSYKPVDKKLGKIRKNSLVDTRTDRVFIPLSKYKILVGNNKKTEKELFVAKEVAKSSSRSFVFSRELLNAMRKNNMSDSLENKVYLFLIERLIRYGHYELFVIQTQNSGVISLNMLPLSFKYLEGKHMSVGQVILPLNSVETIPEGMASIVEKVLNSMNIVLCQLIPDLKIHIKNLGPKVLENGKTGVLVQLMSEKSGVTIPLKNESEGVKKIVSILNLLIAVYNQPSVTVAIDEPDAGVFEYLLGELLRVISEKGKGQFIFTSHNLRPLETIDMGFVAFTSTNPANRYVRISNLKKSNNLRNYYYRDVMLGINEEPLYNMTNNAEIEMAFREAGDMNVT